MIRENSTERHPLLSIWLHPRVAIQQVTNQKAEFVTYLLVTLAGVPYILDEIELNEGFGWLLQLHTILFKGLIFGMMTLGTGWLSLYCTGKWLGGKARANDIWYALVWSAVPTISISMLMLILLVLPASAANNSVLVIGLIAVEVIAGIWSFILCLNTLSQVQGFSVYKVLLNFVLAALMAALVVIALIALFVFGLGISLNLFNQ